MGAVNIKLGPKQEINQSTKVVKIFVENVRLPLRVLLNTIGSEKEGKCGKIEI